jgi:hypothetical protein
MPMSCPVDRMAALAKRRPQFSASAFRDRAECTRIFTVVSNWSKALAVAALTVAASSRWSER